MSRAMRFPTIWHVRSAKAQTSLRICADWSEHLLVAWIFYVKLLTKHYLEFLSLKGGCTGSSESTLVKMSHCWKSHVTAQINHHRALRLWDLKNINAAWKTCFTPIIWLDISCQSTTNHSHEISSLILPPYLSLKWKQNDTFTLVNVNAPVVATTSWWFHQCVVSMRQKMLPVRCNKNSSIKHLLVYQEKNPK